MDPVIVIGNGPVGQTAALLLARWRLPVVVLDQRPARDLVGSKAICQQRDVLDIWESVGAGQQIAEEGLTWSRARTYYREHELLCITLEDRGRSPFPPFVNISQSRTEEILDRRIAECDAIDVHWQHEVVALAQDRDGVTVSCRTPAGAVELRAPYVVACAGGRGDVIRRDLGLSFDGRTFDDHFLICDIRADLGAWAHERRFYFDPEWNPGRQVLIHPCPDSTYRIDWQVPPDFDLDAEELTGALDQRVRRIIGDRDYEVVWKSVYRFHSRVVDRMRAGRVLVAGDLAHLFAPFGARGLNSGVQDVENAAWKLAFVLNAWAPEALLESYHDERHAAALENLDITAATMRFLVPQTDEEWAWRRTVLDRAVREPEARGLVDSGRLAEPFWYVDSPLTTGDLSRPFPGRPPKGSAPPVVPGVLVPDLPVHLPDRSDVTRLRAIARDGVLALTSEGVDTAVVAAAVKEATTAPARVLALADIDVELCAERALGTRPGEAWLIRPDGHLSAIVTEPTRATVHSAVRRMLAL